eukprot:3883389-Pleurochrysis_carterae.AAC.2
MRVLARSSGSAAALSSPPFSEVKACIMPAAMAAARKRAFAANEMRGQERAVALAAAAGEARSPSTQGAGATASTVCCVGGEGDGEPGESGLSFSESAQD